MNGKFLKFLKFNLNSVRNSETKILKRPISTRKTEDDIRLNLKNLTYIYEMLLKKDLELWLLNYTNPIMKTTNLDENDKYGIFRLRKNLQRLERFLL